MKVQIVEAIEREDFSKFPATIYGKGFIRLYAQFVGLDPQPLLEEYAKSMAARKSVSLTGDGRRADADSAARRDVASAQSARLPVGAVPPSYNEGEFRVIGPAEKPREEGGAEPAEGIERTAAVSTSCAGPDLFSRAEAPPVRPLAEVAAEPAPRPAAQTEAPPPPPPTFHGADAPPSGSASLQERFASVWRARKELGRPWRALDFHDYPLRSASVLVGIAIVVVLALSTLSQCSGPKKPARVATVKPQQELQVVVQPPDPYFD
jgi:hypothetical protein